MKLQELRKQLYEMKERHFEMWMRDGSELCAGDMLRQEKELENKIEERVRLNKAKRRLK